MTDAPDKQDMVEQFGDHMQDDPTLTEVFDVFDTSELYVHKSRRSNTLLKWNRADNKYIDDAVWSHNASQGRVPRWVYDLFEAAGVENK